MSTDGQVDIVRVAERFAPSVVHLALVEIAAERDRYRAALEQIINQYDVGAYEPDGGYEVAGSMADTAHNALRGEK